MWVEGLKLPASYAERQQRADRRRLGTTFSSAGAGNNVLIGGRGRNVLIGGRARTASSRRQGRRPDRRHDDYDMNEAALRAVLAEWTSHAELQTRVGHLLGTLAGGLNGSYHLNADTVHDDGDRDVLYGGGQSGLVPRRQEGPGEVRGGTARS